MRKATLSEAATAAADLVVRGSGVASAAQVVERLAAFEAEVAMGRRDSRTLVTIPAELARAASLTFPEQPFGPVKPGEPQATRRLTKSPRTRLPTVSTSSSVNAAACFWAYITLTTSEALTFT
jgi:hypothetical protein